DILFDYNIQHDCYSGKCTVNGERTIMQERTTSGQTEKFVEHTGLERFVINTHSFHKAHRLRDIDALQACLRPKPLYPDRQKHHEEAAATLRANKAA
ncbi:hypothetical protein FA15DRAFT_570789, partial [Coprinopsis marcescibilis]